MGPGKAHCKPNGWGGEEVIVLVNCYTPSGARVDSKFTVLFTLPAANVAYAWGNDPSNTYYSPLAPWSSNPAGPIVIRRDTPGYYHITWPGVDPSITGSGSVQVTAYGTENAQCIVSYYGPGDGLTVICSGPTGIPVDTKFLVLYHS